MKKLIKVLYIAAGLAAPMACREDFVDRPPLDAIAIDNFYQTEEQLNSATAALYGWPWFEFNDKANWVIGDAMSGNHYTNDGEMAQFYTFGVRQNNAHMNEAWNSFFRVIAHSNSVINNVPSRAAATIAQELKDRVVGEARYMRGLAYFYLVRLWGPVPIIEDNGKIAFDPIVPKNTEEDVYKLIIRDLEFAVANCPPAYSGADVGRVTSWAAKAMLAKVYLQKSTLSGSGRNQEDLEKAKEYARDVISNSGAQLMSNYADLFKQANDNNPESLFAFQWIACQDWGTQNTNQAYFAHSNLLTGTGDGWGGWIGPTIDLQGEYEEGDARRSATIMQNGDVYPELQKKGGGYKYVVNPTDDFSESATFAAIKKYVVGNPDDNGGSVCFMSTGVNTYVQRLADVYLIYAEAILGNNDITVDPEALNAVNKIRTRAKLSNLDTLSFKSILHERRIEFAYEGQFWYDLVRYHDFDPTGAINYIANQERGNYYWQGATQMLDSRKYTVTSKDFKLPIPTADADKNPKLLEEPVPYEFKN